MDKKPFVKILRYLDNNFTEEGYENGDYNYPFNKSTISNLFDNLQIYNEYLDIDDFFQEKANINFNSDSMLEEQYNDVEDALIREQICVRKRILIT